MLFSEANTKCKEVQMQAYCVKDRRKVEIKNPRTIRMKNGRRATQGICPRCGTKVEAKSRFCPECGQKLG